MIHRIVDSRTAGALLLILTLSSKSQAQFSAFVSGTYGYQSNPLYNCQQAGDQVRSTYLELAYQAGPVRGTYVGGLTLFNALNERNYLEHRLSLAIPLRSRPGSEAGGDVAPENARGNEALQKARGEEPPESPDGDEAPENADGDEGNPAPEDSLGAFGELSARLSARHDRPLFKEYDNAAATVLTSLRWGFDAWHIRLLGEGVYRVYPSTQELSNATGVLTAELGLGDEGGISGGLRSIGGVKHYTVAAVDSSRFEPVRTYVTVTKPGSGKGGARITVKETSGKQILANADVRTTGHIAGSGYCKLAWGTGSMTAELLYRHNLSASARILARTSETATINEDLYNDFFSYQGPEGDLSLRQTLPGSIQIILTLQHQRNQYGAPAFDLEGNEVAGARIDRRTEINFYLSRYFPLSSTIGLDIAASGGAMRSESNDAYNDFSGWSLGLSLGIGF
jgi:hypothetical protein